jgi:hypothetical protein
MMAFMPGENMPETLSMMCRCGDALQQDEWAGFCLMTYEMEWKERMPLDWSDMDSRDRVDLRTWLVG